MNIQSQSQIETGDFVSDASLCESLQLAKMKLE